MGLFDKLNSPVFYLENSSLSQQLSFLQELLSTASVDAKIAIENEIRLINAGLVGENQIRFELENSHIPMYVLHDLYLEHNGLSAQIDYLIITRHNIYVLECKNLCGNIEINNSGDFIRTFTYGNQAKREGIYSPITQNRRHLELIKELRSSEKNLLVRTLFEKSFYDTYRSIVVLANPKTVLNSRCAKKEVRDQVIRADQLISYIRNIDKSSTSTAMSDKEMEALAKFYADAHNDCPTDYLEKFRKLLAVDPSAAAQSEFSNEPVPHAMICPKCGAQMVKRTAKKGPNLGNSFWGCSRYPKCRMIVDTDAP